MTYRKSSKVALGGIITALCIVTMLLTAFLPFATFALPGIAGFFLTILVIELNVKWAMLGYVASSLLALLVVPDKEAVFIYIFLLGLYPILKSKFEGDKSNTLSYALKFLYFNVSIVACYLILIFVFQLGAVVEEFSGISVWVIFGLLAMGNVTFFIYDIALTQCIKLYIQRIRNKLIKPR